MPPSNSPAANIAFIVEGQTDRFIVETLANKIAEEQPDQPPPRFASVSLSGSPRVRNIFPTISALLRKGFGRVIVVFDTDSIDATENDRFVGSLGDQLVREGLADRVTLVPIVPEIESWILADAETVESTTGHEVSRDPNLKPKQRVQRILGTDPGSMERLVRQLRPERISLRNASFQKFAQSLREALRASPKAA